MNIKNNTTIISSQPTSPDDSAGDNHVKHSPPDEASTGVPSSQNESKSPESKTEELEQDSTSKLVANSESKRSQVSKRVGNKNALSHGVHVEALLPWESEAEYTQLHDSFKKEWQPTGASEEHAVRDLTHWTWIKWRAAKMAQIRYYSDPLISDVLKSDKTSWLDILEIHKKLPEAADCGRGVVNLLIGKLNDFFETIRAQRFPTDTTDGKEIQSELSELGHKVDEFIDIAKNRLFPAVDEWAEITKRTSKMIALPYQPETMEQEVRVMAAIEARIDKVLARLMTLKEYKRIFVTQGRPSHLIESPSVVPAKARK
jgi:hypothetical protein